MNMAKITPMAKTTPMATSVSLTVYCHHVVFTNAAATILHTIKQKDNSVCTWIY